MSAFIHGSNTSDIRLAASIMAMGIFCDTKNGSAAAGNQRVWLFSEVSDCGNWKLSDLAKWWRDASFHKTNPSHAFNGVKCTMASHKALNTAFKSGGAVIQEWRGNSLIFVPSSHAPKRPQATPGQYITDDTRLLSALAAAGFCAHDVDCGGERRFMQVASTSETGKALASHLANWNDAGYEKRNPQAHFAYCKAAIITHGALTFGVKNDRTLQHIQVGESFAYLHPDCSAETEAEIMGQFNR